MTSTNKIIRSFFDFRIDHGSSKIIFIDRKGFSQIVYIYIYISVVFETELILSDFLEGDMITMPRSAILPNKFLKCALINDQYIFNTIVFDFSVTFSMIINS